MMAMVTDRIGIGDASDGLQLPPAVDATLNVALEHEITLRGGDAHRHKVGLLDGSGNDDFAILAAVLLLHSLGRKYRRILVHCTDGGTRSIVIVAAYVYALWNIPYEKVVDDILKQRGKTEYSIPLYKQVLSLLPRIKNLVVPV